MILYVIYFLVNFVFLILFLSTISLYKKERIYRYFVISSILFLCLFAIFISGFRYDTGTDYWNYYNQYSLIKEYGFKVWFEPLYVLIVLIIQKINLDFQFMIFFFPFLSYLLMCYFLKKVFSIWYIILVIYFIDYILVFQMGAIRFAVALSIVSFSIIYAIKRDFYKFLFIVLISSLIHQSMVLFIFVYFIVHLNFSTKTMFLSFIFVLIISFFLSKNIFLDLYNAIRMYLSVLPSINAKLYYYLSRISGMVHYTTLLKKIALMLYFLYFRNKIIIRYPIYNYFFNIVYFGYIIYLLLYNVFPVFTIRVSTIFSFFEITLLVFPLFLVKKGFNKLLIGCFVVLVVISPYIFTLISRGVYFIPYKSILF